MIRRVMTLVLLTFALAAPALPVAVDEKPLADPALEARARALMKEVRCLVCQNQSIEDSNADLARDLRKIVRERVAGGDDDAAVKAYLVARYGDWVLLKPPVDARTYFLWGSPVLFLLLVLVFALMRKRTAGPEALSEEEKAELSRILKEDKRP